MAEEEIEINIKAKELLNKIEISKNSDRPDRPLSNIFSLLNSEQIIDRLSAAKALTELAKTYCIKFETVSFGAAYIEFSLKGIES